jgi:hypothetical protein
MRCTSKQFIDKAMRKWGDEYDYSKVNYIKSQEKVIIICKKHGEFEQRPNDHLSNYMCPKCSIEKRSNTHTMTTKEFIERAKYIHGDRYDYTKVDYVNCHTKVIIKCKKHGEFQQIAYQHLSSKGGGCHDCNGGVKKNTLQFIKQAEEVHKDRYDYTKVEYVNCHTDIIIKCKEHGEFEQTPSIHLRGCGCPICGGGLKKNTLQFIEQAKEVHKDIYDYSKVDYINGKSNVTIVCNTHGPFQQIANSHLNGQGCRKCFNQKLSELKTKPLSDFIERAKNIHGDKYDYSLIEYTNLDERVNIICRVHGEYFIKPTKHIHRSQGCPRCQVVKNHSSSSIEWLNFIQLKYKIYIQHAENNKEYKIPNTNFKADGYCEETNTIYEYYGDYWHGNPQVYSRDSINKTIKCSFGELYKKTLEREEAIQNMGFNLVTIWEYKWVNINKCIRILQKNVKKYLQK